jgi:membrane protease YdiL (CAAX protease family)
VSDGSRGLGLAPLLRRHFGGRQNALTSALALAPLFLTYQIGILLGARGRNGADFVTRALIDLCDSDPGVYAALLGVLTVAYAGLVVWLRRRRSAHARLFAPMLVESFVYAFFMGGVIQVLIVRLDRFVPLLAIAARGPLDVAVISAGAGFHEELVFRAGLLAGGIRLLSLAPLPGARTWGPLVALLLSSVAFAAVHHLGPGTEPVTSLALAYRTLAGMIFGLIYLYRGLGVAAWTHALYDVLVLAME